MPKNTLIVITKDGDITMRLCRLLKQDPLLTELHATTHRVVPRQLEQIRQQASIIARTRNPLDAVRAAVQRCFGRIAEEIVGFVVPLALYQKELDPTKTAWSILDLAHQTVFPELTGVWTVNDGKTQLAWQTQATARATTYSS